MELNKHSKTFRSLAFEFLDVFGIIVSNADDFHKNRNFEENYKKNQRLRVLSFTAVNTFLVYSGKSAF